MLTKLLGTILLVLLALSLTSTYGQILEIVVIERDTREILVGAKVVIVGNKMETPIEVFTDEVGRVFVNLQDTAFFGTEINIAASMPKYLSDGQFYTPSGDPNEIHQVDLFLKSRPSCRGIPYIGYELGEMKPNKAGMNQIDAMIQTLDDNPTIIIRLIFNYSPEEDHGSGISKARADFVKRQFANAEISPNRVRVLIMLGRKSEMFADVVGHKDLK